LKRSQTFIVREFIVSSRSTHVADFSSFCLIQTSRPVFEKTCEATQKNVKSCFGDFEKKRKKRTGRPTQPIVSQAT